MNPAHGPRPEGVGKSKLAVELALWLTEGQSEWTAGTVINADSMQVYSGLDVITNKTPDSERRGVDHQLLSFKSPGQQYFIQEWISDALPLVISSDLSDYAF